jgi:hypothetical protein
MIMDGCPVRLAGCSISHANPPPNVTNMCATYLPSSGTSTASTAIGKIEQDYLRRVVLRERDRPGGNAPALLEQTLRFALDHGYHAVLEGILFRALYGPMLTVLRAAHRGRTSVFYLDVSLAETLRRHRTRPQATEFTAADMRGWYAPRDLLGVDDEHVIPESSTLDATVTRIAATAGLALTGRDDDVPPARASSTPPTEQN